MDHLINFKNYQPDYLRKIIDTALRLKADPQKYAAILKGKRMYMLFQKTSTRTALSFGLGMAELGGLYFSQNWEDSNFVVGEIRDEVRYVARNVDIIMARLKYNEDISVMAEYSPVPVINGCCNRYHPCQALADILTIKELFGDFKIKLLYIGVKNNVLNSLMESLPRLGGELYALTPLINEPSLDPEVDEMARRTHHYHEIDPGISAKELSILMKNVDVVYTDTWVDMEFFSDPVYQTEKEERIGKMMPFQLNSELLAGSKAVVMHDMPIHTGYEITRDIVETHLSTILLQAENRRHAQNGVLVTLLNPEFQSA